MSFLNNFESRQDGINDTVEFVVRVAIITLSAVILVVVLALVVGLFMPNDLVDSAAILELVNPAFQTIIGAFVGLLGGLSLNANARDQETPPEDPLELTTLAPEPNPTSPNVVMDEPIDRTLPAGIIFPENDDDEDDMEPWEKYRNDLRYDANSDGVVDELDFPDWRSAGK